MEERFALLIDADNVSAKYIKPILDELSKYGNVTYKRIYGDWTRPNSAGWKEELLQNAGAAFINPDESQDKAVRKLKSEKERLLKKVGELTLENDFFASACEDAGLKVR